MRILAAFIFFTRLPFWRIREVPAKYFKHVVDYWPLVGWLTGGIAAGTLWLTGQVFPLPVAVLFALLSRLLTTGALHEDGLADFLDGFGGGRDRQQTLAIMKDSHIGTYGVIGLIFYFLLFGAFLSSFDLATACVVLFCGDSWSKFVASQMVNVLPYARKEEESKSKTVYEGMSWGTRLVAFAFGVLPLLLLLPVGLWGAAFFPLVTFFFLIRLMRRRLQGYTGDCCGALFLLCELSFCLAALFFYLIKNG